MNKRRPIISPLTSVILLLLVGPIASCTTGVPATLTAATSDFGAGGQLVPRAIQVAFINNTNFRAIFSFGSYNPLNQDTLPTNSQQLRLEGNTASPQIAQPCRRVFSVGGDELIRLIKENERDPAINVTDPRALVRGVNFSAAPLGDPLEAEPTEGTALGMVRNVGIDFTCDRSDIRDVTGSGLLIFTFEQDPAAPGGFRIDYQFVMP
ncbi:MAG: hypothetical protein ACE5EQ_06435 [Phycisphaerae bacterium]